MTCAPEQPHLSPTEQGTHLPSEHFLPDPHEFSVHLQTALWLSAEQSGVSPEQVLPVQTDAHFPPAHFWDDEQSASDLQSVFFKLVLFFALTVGAVP